MFKYFWFVPWDFGWLTITHRLKLYILIYKIILGELNHFPIKITVCCPFILTEAEKKVEYGYTDQFIS